jgi:hypothetical protein
VWFFPGQLNIGNKAWNVDEVKGSLAYYLVGDVETVTLDVFGLRRPHNRILPYQEDVFDAGASPG